MVRADERNWLKAGLEVTSGAVQVSTVFTRDFSDVSVAPIAGFAGEVSMRVTRFGGRDFRIGPPIARDGLE